MPSDGDLGDGPQVARTGGPATQGVPQVASGLSLTLAHTHTRTATRRSHCHDAHMFTLRLTPALTCHAHLVTTRGHALTHALTARTRGSTPTDTRPFMCPCVHTLRAPPTLTPAHMHTPSPLLGTVTRTDTYTRPRTRTPLGAASHPAPARPEQRSPTDRAGGARGRGGPGSQHRTQLPREPQTTFPGLPFRRRASGCATRALQLF